MENEVFDIKSQEYYYHISPIHLEAGSVIKKGNWGRVIKLYIDNDCNGLNLFSERVLEDIRLSEFPDKPSRLNSIFLLLNEDDARNYQAVTRGDKRTSLIYKVKLLNDGESFHLGNYNRTQVLSPEYHFDGMPKTARKYWSGESLNDLTLIASTPINHSIELIPNMPGKIQVNGLTIPAYGTTIELIVESDIEIVECLNAL